MKKMQKETVNCSKKLTAERDKNKTSSEDRNFPRNLCCL